MSDRDVGDGSAHAKHRVQRRRATRSVIAGGVLTVVGLAGLVITEPVASRDVGELRFWAVWVVVVGLGVTVMGLISRAAPSAEQRPRPPRVAGWLLLIAAGCGVITLVATVSMGSNEPMEYLSPALLTVYPLMIYGFQSWRDRRWRDAHRQATSPSAVD